jgi:spore maturation protein SpmA
MNFIFFALVLIGFVTVGWQQLLWVPAGNAVAPMEKLSGAIVQAAGSSVELALSLMGIMTLFLGLVKVAEAGGLLVILARLIRPLMAWLFPEVPLNHPATGAMILNFSANLMGLGNAATPFGIRAMQELEKLNPCPGTATNAMVLFVAINTAGITLLPTSVIALRAAAGSANPAGILPTTLFSSFCATLFVLFATRAYQRFFPFPNGSSHNEGIENNSGNDPEEVQFEHSSEDPEPYPLWVSGLAFGVLITIIPLTVLYGRVISPWVIPSIIVAFLAFGVAKKVRIYEVFVDGAKEGFQVAVKILPYLVAILVSIGMLRASGAVDAAANMLGAWTAAAGLPPEGLLMAIMRPLSGSGSYGVVASIIKNPAIGPDSYTGYLVSTLQGSSETTFYVLVVYFGAVQIRRIRHALLSGLTAELVAVIAAVAICRYLYG